VTSNQNGDVENLNEVLACPSHSRDHLTFSICNKVVLPALSRPRKSSFACLFVKPSEARTSQTTMRVPGQNKRCPGRGSCTDLHQLTNHMLLAGVKQR
jgi:hypothetical protein